MTRRRWIADAWTETTASLMGEQATHLARVLRAERGQIFDVVAGGFLHRAEVMEVSDDEVKFALHEELEAEVSLPVHLLMAVFKFDAMEWGIEKATELGVAKITPVIARRTEKHLAQAAVKRVERWRRITREASQQSRRSDVPEIAEPMALVKALEGETSAMKILLAETEQENTIAAVLTHVPEAGHGAPGSLREIALAIGPEGGWTAEEMRMFHEHAWKPVTLGPRILRAETAAIAGLAVVAALLQ